MAYKIVLDAGHGGTDPGAVYNGRNEKDDNLALAQAVGKILGHTDQNAIRSYARLDMEQLRGYALPVMEATGIFAEFLEGRWSLS